MARPGGGTEEPVNLPFVALGLGGEGSGEKKGRWRWLGEVALPGLRVRWQ
jgi:hypothetical protein